MQFTPLFFSEDMNWLLHWIRTEDDGVSIWIFLMMPMFLHGRRS